MKNSLFRPSIRRGIRTGPPSVNPNWFHLKGLDFGVSVPKAVLQELLTYYSKSPENPNGISMEAPFELPAGIREIRVGAGTSTVVQ